MEFDLATAGIAGLILFIAYMVRGIAGFGSGLIAVPLLAFYFPLQVVVPVVVFLDYVGSASQGLRNRQIVAWRELVFLIPFALIGITIGLTFLTTLEPGVLSKALGGFVIVIAVYQLLPLPDLRGPRIFAVPCGLFGGCIGALFGTGGPFYVIFLTLRGLEKSVFRATFATNFLIDGAIRLVAYASFGLLQTDVLIAMAGALPIVILALWLGGRVHADLSRQTYARIISVLLLGTGLTLLLKA